MVPIHESRVRSVQNCVEPRACSKVRGSIRRRALRQTEGTRLRSAARLSSGAKCRPAEPGRKPDGAPGGNCTALTGFAVAS
jgi:hypothetical protein